MIFNKFIINEEVIFDSDANELQSLYVDTTRVTLNAPTSRCLKLLLESNGSVISREEFLVEVWNTRGVVVSQNTFYQNISLMRKSLKEAGLSRDIVVTVRKRGFSLASDVKVTLLSNDDNSNTDKVKVIDGNVAIAQDEMCGENKKKLTSKSASSFQLSYLNVPVWILILLIVMLSVNIIVLIFHLIV